MVGKQLTFSSFLKKELLKRVSLQLLWSCLLGNTVWLFFGGYSITLIIPWEMSRLLQKRQKLLRSGNLNETRHPIIRVPLVLIFIDYKKAFDSVHHSVLWKVLWHQGISLKCINIKNVIHGRSKCKVNVGESLFDSFEINNGVLQFFYCCYLHSWWTHFAISRYLVARSRKNLRCYSKEAIRLWEN